MILFLETKLPSTGIKGLTVKCNSVEKEAATRDSPTNSEYERETQASVWMCQWLLQIICVH